jgi:hypothetical protein
MDWQYKILQFKVLKAENLQINNAEAWKQKYSAGNKTRILGLSHSCSVKHFQPGAST